MAIIIGIIKFICQGFSQIIIYLTNEFDYATVFSMKNLIVNYLNNENISQSELAERAGLSKQLIQWHAANPKSAWRGSNAVKIERATGGKILAYDLVFTNPEIQP